MSKLTYNIWQCPRCKHLASDKEGLKMGWCTATKPYPRVIEDPQCGLFNSGFGCSMWDKGKMTPDKLRRVLEECSIRKPRKS